MSSFKMFRLRLARFIWGPRFGFWARNLFLCLGLLLIYLLRFVPGDSPVREVAIWIPPAYGIILLLIIYGTISLKDRKKNFLIAIAEAEAFIKKDYWIHGWLDRIIENARSSQNPSALNIWMKDYEKLLELKKEIFKQIDKNEGEYARIIAINRGLVMALEERLFPE